MPVVHFHLIEGVLTQDEEKEFLAEATQIYALVLECPIDRVRAFIQSYKSSCILVSGKECSATEFHAPYFEYIVLEGRSLEQRKDLMVRFTDLVERKLRVDRQLIRGRCIRVSPEDWGIGGELASCLRKNEIELRIKNEAP